VAITVAELVEVPFLRMRIHAGGGGGGRQVNWAHASDLPSPTEWLAPRDLLMSNGLSFPADAKEQVSFLLNLAAADLSGFAIGDDMDAAPLTPPFLAAAEEFDFPVLAIPREVPFVAVSRAVANANSGEEQRRLVKTAQLYESLREGVTTDRLGAPLLSELSRQLDCRLVLLDALTALPVLPTEDEAPGVLSAGLVEELRDRKGVFPGVLRLKHDDAVAFVIRVPVARPTALLGLQEGDQPPELALLQHAANIAALEAERAYSEREHSHRLGAELLAQLVEHSLDPGSALRQLEDRGIAPQESVLVAFLATDDDGPRDLHHELAERRQADLVLWDGRRGLVALSDTEEALSALRSALGEDVPLGVSDRLCRADRVPDAAREAKWAGAAARNLERERVRYGDEGSLFLPRTLGEADMAAERVLGRVISYDAEHPTELVRSLAVFLEHNRSWLRSAEALHVHKQTLVYRMRRVEELTGRDLRDTADVVQLWLALRALEFANGGVEREGPTPTV
jgi:purine catabolism regulator